MKEETLFESLNEFFKKNRNLSNYLKGIFFMCGALHILLLMLFVLNGDEPFISELGTSFFICVSVFVGLILVGFGAHFLDKIK